MTLDIEIIPQKWAMSKIVKQESKEFIHFFKNILIQLNYYGWKMEFAAESYCWKHRKVITIGYKVEDKKQMILHEIAHIGTCRFCNQKHNHDFWKHFDDLMMRFLPNETISEEQIEHKKFVTKGIYRLDYAD